MFFGIIIIPEKFNTFNKNFLFYFAAVSMIIGFCSSICLSKKCFKLLTRRFQKNCIVKCKPKALEKHLKKKLIFTL